MLEELDRLVALHKSGALTDTEFAAAKAQLLASRAPARGWRDRMPPVKSARTLIAAAVVLLLAVGATAYALRPSPAPAAQDQVTTVPGGSEADTPAAQAPTQDPASPDPATTSADYSSALSVTDSGWGVIMDNSFTTWAAVITNTSDAWLETSISAVAVNAAGAPVDTSALTDALAPNSTSRVGGTFANATGVRGVKVQAAPNFAQDHALYNGDTTLTGALTGTQYDTKIAWTLKSGLDSTLKQGAAFFAVFRDRAGHIVGGGSYTVPVTVAPGATQAFATSAGQLTAPDTAVTVEGWVNPEGFAGAS